MKTREQEKERLRAHYSSNKEVIKKRAKAYRLKNIDKIKVREAERRKLNKARYHAYFLQYKYGINANDYAQMLEKQGGKCAVTTCGNDGSEDKRRRRLFVDHCHTTGKVRGLLCCRCNRVLGMLKEMPVLIRGLASYIETINAS